MNSRTYRSNFGSATLTVPAMLRLNARTFALACTLAFATTACSGGSSDTPVVTPTPVVSVAVAAPTAAIAASGTYQFTATVTGTTNTSVTWSVDAAGTTNVGTITTAGLYTAPPAAGTFTVRATSVADASKSGTASITVNPPPITVAITPSSTTLGAGGSVQLSASVTGSTNGAVTWDLPGGASTGTLVSNGTANALYTAPNTLGSYQVRATSTADNTKFALATITVPAGSGFRVTGPARVAPLASTQFTASFNDVAENATWSFDGAANGCTVSSTGVFTAGATTGTVTLRATDAASRTATATISVATQVTLDIVGPTSPTLTTADMLTFYWSISPTGVNTAVNWSVSAGGGTTVPVDYFRGFIPSNVTGPVTITATSVADPTVSRSFIATLTAPGGGPFSATTGAPSSPRYEHASATLTDGRIVLIGGQRSRGVYTPLTTTDIFNPTTGTFTSGPALTTSRIEAEAIAVDANRVLVTGGVEDYNLAYNSAELVNVSTGTSVATTNAMTTRRLFHQMVALTTGANAGKIAVIGGFNGPIPYGIPAWQSTALVELFDPTTNRFTPYSASMKTPRGLFTATPLADGRILIAGGYDAAAFNTLASAEIFDPVAGTFTFTGSMAKPRSAHTATRLNDGTVLITGGSSNNDDGATAELYNPSTGLFESVNGTMSVSRKHHAAALLGDGRVAVMGGESFDNWVRGTVEVYTPSSRTFAPLGYMSVARRRPTASVITIGPNAGRILILGGGAEDKLAGAAEIVR